jgi:hypothetical protein
MSKSLVPLFSAEDLQDFDRISTAADDRLLFAIAELRLAKNTAFAVADSLDLHAAGSAEILRRHVGEAIDNQLNELEALFSL